MRRDGIRLATEDRTRRRQATAVLAGVLVCSGALPLSACAGIDFRGVDCSVSGDLPHESSGSPGYIVSKGRVVCQGRGVVNSVTASLKIQVAVRGVWLDVPKTAKSETFERPALGKTLTVQNHPMSCRPGVFRTAVRIDSHIDGQDIKVFGGSWGYSKSVSNPCGYGAGHE